MSSSRLSSLPPRPPTPPKDQDHDLSRAADDALRFLEDGHDATPQKPLCFTHPQSSPRSPASTSTSGSTNAKKVGFSPWPPTVHTLSCMPTRTPALTQTPLRHSSKPLKSILKAVNGPLPPTPDEIESRLGYFSPQQPGSFRKMLQSVLNQLASPSRDERFDAYLALTGALKAFKDVPDSAAIIDNIQLLQQFIARDMAWKDVAGKLDINIVTQALTLTGALIFNPRVASAFDSDFRAFLVERSIAIFQQSNVPKAVVRNHMYLMAQQRFGAAIVTSVQADRIVNAVQTIEDRCTGNSIVAARLTVYQRLLEQAPTTMLHRMRDWIEHVFHGMLSNIDDTRNRAIEICSQAGLRLGHQPQAAKILFEVFDKVDEEEDDTDRKQEPRTYGEYINGRLMGMTKDKVAAPFVPQIWAAITLLVRNKKRPLDRWSRIRDWLMIIQICLNAGDPEVKHQANIAWNKLVFSVMPDAATGPTIRSILKVPIKAALEKLGNDKLLQDQRQIAMHSYCNLLHYGLRPTLSPAEIDVAWDLYVDEILTSLTSSRSKGRQNVCRIIHGFLKKSNGAWNATAAIESAAIHPEDLPRLDAKWIRSRVGKIIKILEPVLIAGMYLMPDANKTADLCWRQLLEAVAEAGSQEVKTSDDLKNAIAQITNLLRRIWNSKSQPRHAADGSVWVDRYQSLLKVAVEVLGPSHFIEDILSETETNQIEVAATPSHRHTKHSQPAHPAFLFLFALYHQPRVEIRTSGVYRDSAVWFLRLLTLVNQSPRHHIKLLSRALQLSKSYEVDVEISGQLWNAVADAALESLRTRAFVDECRSTGVDLSCVLSIVVHGLQYAGSNSCCLARVLEVYSAAIEISRDGVGEDSVCVGVMVPFAKSVFEALPNLQLNTALSLCDTLLRTGVWPKHRQESDRSRKILWSAGLDLPKTTVLDPFDPAYCLVSSAMEEAYNDPRTATSDASSILSLLEALIGFLQRCPFPDTALSHALQKMQRCIAVWVEDRCRRVFPPSDSEMSDITPSDGVIAAALPDVWSGVLQIVDKFPRKDSSLLQLLEPLLIAGFSCPCKDIVNQTVLFWNTTFGEEETLDYPAAVLPVLLARRIQTSLQLPGLAEDDCFEVADLPCLAESAKDPKAVSNVASNNSYNDVSQDRGTGIREKSPIPQLSSHERLPRNLESKAPCLDLVSETELCLVDFQMELAPLDSSPAVHPQEEPSILANHQREAMRRNEVEAQMFPNFSSSPKIFSPEKANGVAKKLDFTLTDESRPGHEPVTTTPDAPTEKNPMSDDLPSSPTPRGGTPSTVPEAYGVSSDDEGTIVDPPSSPPRRESDHARQYATGADAATIIESIMEDGDGLESRPSELAVIEDGTEQIEPISEDSMYEQSTRPDELISAELPSDTPLPTVQLEREAAAAEAANLHLASTAACPDLASVAQRTIAVRQTQEIAEERDRMTQQQSLSRVEDSMIQHREAHDTFTETPQCSPSITPTSSQVSRKRKRASKSQYTTRSKRNKSSSPFTQFFTSLLGGREAIQQDDNNSDVEDEGNIEEEIVVASTRAQLSRMSEDSVEHSEPVRADYQQEPEAVAQTGKRKRGRPRKAVTHPSIQVEEPQANDQERSFSGTSTRDASSASIKKLYPVLSSRRKLVRRSARLSQETPVMDDTLGMAAASVQSQRISVADIDNGAQWAEEEAEDEEDDDEAGSRQQAAEQAPAVSGRAVAQPKSILARLRGVLSDFVGSQLVFGSQEEKEFDLVMSRIRLEGHEAGMRGRQ